MPSYINCTVNWADNSTGAAQDTGQEVQIFTDSPSFVANVPVEHAAASHAWMRLSPVAADAVSTSFRLEAPASYLKVRVRQFNANGYGPWSNAAGELFSLSSSTSSNVPLAPSAVGLAIGATPAEPAPIPDPEDPAPTVPVTATTYSYASQYSGVQGQSSWSYRDTNGNLLTYSSLEDKWNGNETYLAIWSNGFHHGFNGTHAGPVLRWTAPANGTAVITGEYRMHQAGGGATAIIKHNASTIFSQAMTDTTSYPYSETEVMLAGEYIDFILEEDTAGVNNNTVLNPSIAFTTDGTTPANPEVSTLTSSASLNVGTITNLTVTLSSAAVSAATVSLSSSDDTKATVPASIVIPVGGTSGLVPVTGVAAGSATITATYNSTSKQSAITVTTPSSGGVWPNLPSGMTKVTDCPFNDTFPTADGWFNAYNTFPFASPNISGTSFSPPRVLDHYLAANSTTGNGQWGLTFPASREVYCAFYWATNAGFQGIANNGNKMIFIRNPNAGDNSYFGWMGSQDAPRVLKWNQQGVVNNTHIPTVFNTNYPTDGTGWFEPNINTAAATVAAGTGWRLIEIYLKSSTTSTSQDGIIKWWVAGTLCGSYNNANLCVGGFTEMHITSTWDGSAIFTSQYRDTSREWHHYYDHMYFARRT